MSARKGLLRPLFQLRVIGNATFIFLAGCSVSSIGAEERTQREEAELHKLLDMQPSFLAIVHIMKNRAGYRCDEPHVVDFQADRKTGMKLSPPKPGTVFACNRSMDLNVPGIGCSWEIFFNLESMGNDAVDFLSIDGFKSCH